MKKEKKIKEKKVKDKEIAIEEPKEEKKPNKLVEGFNMYKFIIKLAAAVLLLAFAVVLAVEINDAKFLLLFVTGAIALLTGLIRLILVAKSERVKEAKRITIVETLIHIALGGYLIAAAFIFKNDPEGSISLFNVKYYGLFLAAILYVKAVAYFWQTVLYKQNSTKFMFWMHIIFVTVAVLFAAFANKVGVEQIIWTLFGVSIVCAIVIGGEAGGGYYRYRRSLNPKKEKQENKGDSKEMPAKDEDKIIGEIDPSIIPEKDSDTDTPIVS